MMTKKREKTKEREKMKVKVTKQVTTDRTRQENDACESDNLLESEDNDEDIIANCKFV